jgi:soluble lytic murein transglycosylase-like protein
VRDHDAVIEREARAQGVDPDLVRAIMYYENADGNLFGLGKKAEEADKADTLLPMNINPKIWASMGGVGEEEFKDPEKNIRAGVALIKGIWDRLRPEDRTAAKIGSIYNFTGRENVSRRGARIGRIFDERSWEK